jgi:hypothetical protein
MNSTLKSVLMCLASMAIGYLVLSGAMMGLTALFTSGSVALAMSLASVVTVVVQLLTLWVVGMVTILVFNLVVSLVKK